MEHLCRSITHRKLLVGVREMLDTTSRTRGKGRQSVTPHGQPSRLPSLAFLKVIDSFPEAFAYAPHHNGTIFTLVPHIPLNWNGLKGGFESYHVRTDLPHSEDIKLPIIICTDLCTNLWKSIP